jgi:starch-binding outer membrane protein, SusD/RagB family
MHGQTKKEIMKNYIVLIMLAGLVGVSSCKKTGLQLLNPNSPTPASLATKAGIESFALGLFQKWVANDPDGNGIVVAQVAFANHSILGDEEWISAGNWGFRWTDQVYAITLPAPYNTKVLNPFGTTELAQLKTTNSRQAGSTNSFLYEWSWCYYLIGQANQLLASAGEANLQVSASERSALQAWALWWKGFAYSRIGSMYIAGVVTSATGGTTNAQFVDHNTVIQAADSCFDAAIAILGTTTEDADYDATMTAIIPSFNNNGTIITPAEWSREMYTYEARNLLANKKVKDMTSADWTALTTLASKGLKETDNVFVWGMDPQGSNDLSASFWHPYAMHASSNAGWSWVSERLIQDFKAGDNRFTQGFTALVPAQVNRSSRGIQFGTRWLPVDIEDGGLYASDLNQGALPFACSWDENALMLGEALIRSGSIDQGLTYVDQVRDQQNAGLAHVSGTGLTQDQAIEELRRERRIGLYLRGVAFYDARRWGVTEPAANGGGRAGGIVDVPGNLIGGGAAQALACLIDYNYPDYWDVPQNELDFNIPASGSAATAN